MMIETTRFGAIEVENNDVITFPEGMLGFSKIHKYVLVERIDDSLFIWLQALKKNSVAFPLLEPQIFEFKYKVELGDEDREILQLDDLKHAKVFAIVTIPTDPTKMTANLKAPIVINVKKKLARQVILLASDYPIRQAIYPELQAYCTSRQKTVFPKEHEVPQYQAVHLAEEFTELSGSF